MIAGVIPHFHDEGSPRELAPAAETQRAVYGEKYTPLYLAKAACAFTAAEIDVKPR